MMDFMNDPSGCGAGLLQCAETDPKCKTLKDFLTGAKLENG
jgi:hypothetical protein